MHLQASPNSQDTNELEKFSKWILDVGDGKLFKPNDGIAEIDIQKELLIDKFQDPMKAIVESMYPYLLQKYLDDNYLKSKVILASTIDVVDQINQYVLKLILGDEK